MTRFLSLAEFWSLSAGRTSGSGNEGNPDGWKLEATAHGWGPADAELFVASAARLVDVRTAPEELR